MQNSYLIVGFIILVIIVGVVFVGKKTEAPIEQNPSENTNTSGEDGSYELVASSSILAWKGEYFAGLSEQGTVNFKEGRVTISNGMINSGEFVIDMNSIDSVPHNDQLVNHLKTTDFFEVETYPTAKFVLKSMTPASEKGAELGRYVFAGDLTVKNITKPISFMATIRSDQNNLTAKASFAINRADWEIKYNSPTFFNNLADKVIRDAVEIKLDLQARKMIQ